MSEVSIAALQNAIREKHRCESVWVESVPVKEIFDGETVWDGEVQVFDLPDFVTAPRCYVWSSVVYGRRRFFVVLLRPPVDSPYLAVRVAIIKAYRRSRLIPERTDSEVTWLRSAPVNDRERH